ncbi:anti-sigma regulatory factor (Ser/Thr protein kinase) [Desulfobotulus alkaliphilus]|uniref:Anti-sigma regulatory factor (Ser/Thr protein kinase) n=1 Tax=Desulfobotulus alkaliphilus TaxID=622671 RepID=A0A562S7G2_9BACT|nr:ATP-binding protein [Desulfobotulus alkaliphilus]TWI77327.1 anti-sigma regulatory factor (Ser/Thr protein kinase) [Desulfobotulus alkaliphilus]
MHLIAQQLIKEKGSAPMVRSRLRAVSMRMGFNEVQRERIQIAASEAMSNQVKFATGSGILQIWEHIHPTPALDLFALDHGPGIADLNRALQDGFSTAQTLGRGLGSIQRAADIFDIYTKKISPGMRSWCGTALWIRFYPAVKMQPPLHSSLRTGTFLRAFRDHIFNGDSLSTASDKRFFNWIHLDGLGHGRNAAETAQALHRLPEPGSDPAAILTTLNQRLHGSRGAMGLAIRVDTKKRIVDYAGLGDLVLRCHSPLGTHQPHFPGGVLGRGGGSPGTGTFELPEDALITSSSDGINGKDSLENLPGIQRCHPQLMAFLLGNIHGRDHDDKSLFIMHYRTDQQTEINSEPL